MDPLKGSPGLSVLDRPCLFRDMVAFGKKRVPSGPPSLDSVAAAWPLHPLPAGLDWFRCGPLHRFCSEPGSGSAEGLLANDDCKSYNFKMFYHFCGLLMYSFASQKHGTKHLANKNEEGNDQIPAFI